MGRKPTVKFPAHLSEVVGFDPRPTFCYEGGGGAAHVHELFLVFVSVIVHFVVPGGVCNEPLPRLVEKSILPNTLTLAVLCWSVNMHPCAVTVPLPV